MKIIRSPLRITLGGGGTDLPGWYREHGGFLISAAINKYIYFTGMERPFDRKIWLSYSKVEVCDHISEVKHDMLAKCLQKYSLPDGVEMHSASDLPGKSGMGSSGSFLVAALTCLNALKKVEVNRQQLAEQACRIEMEELGRSSGKQDQYIATFGGIITMDIDRSGEVKVKPLELDPIYLKSLQNNLLIYYMGGSRESEQILGHQDAMFRQKVVDTVSKMKRIQEIGYESKDCLLTGDLDRFGRLLHEHWEVKKSITEKMSNPSIDRFYEQAMGVSSWVLVAAAIACSMFSQPSSSISVIG
jgi:D-glycero-alpha-D-manno-heptose-7-phosphate kinase